MCGIVGYVGPREVAAAAARRAREARVPRLRQRRHLGPARGDRIDAVRAVGNLSALRSALDARRTARRQWPRPRSPRPEPGPGSATRAGRPTGASPRQTRTRTSTPPTASTSSSTGSSRTTSRSRSELIDDGAVFTSETDAEVIAHLIARHYDGDLVEAVRDGLRRASRPLRVRGDERRRARVCWSAHARNAR